MSATIKPITTAAEAEELMAHLAEVMDALVAIVQQETELVRAGHLVKAAELEARKGELARAYVAATLRLQRSRPQFARFAPVAPIKALRERHDQFRALLQMNLTVLATAHAVSEGIIRGLSDRMVRKSAPQTYGASGRTNVPSRGAAVPLAVSRSL
jgi:hypothetical protein